MENGLKNKINEYINAYTKKVKKFTSPQIYTANKDLSKRWYVYYYYRHPETGKLKLQTPIYNGINRIKSLKERTQAIHALRNIVEQVLQDGFNPYDSTETQTKTKTKTFYLHQAIEYALNFWQNTVTENTLRDYKSRLNQFLKWSQLNSLRYTPVEKITKKIIISHLNEVLKNTSVKNRNNQRVALSAFFSLMEKHDYISQNPVTTIDILKTKPKRHRTYSSDQEKRIFSYLKANDPQMLLFVKFVSYNFLRPLEVARLQVKDINFTDKILTVKTKTNTLKTKIIPDILLSELQFLKNHNLNDYIFSPGGVGAWSATETNRRDYWTKRFKKVKEHFLLGENYGIYSFRHTFITKLYRNLRKTMTPFEVKSNLMLITGHSSMQALEKYLRDIDAELPTDYSHLIV